MDWFCKPCNFATSHEGSYKRHVHSVCHQKIALIRAMLEKNCIRQTEIAKRVGVTRERIRQIAGRMGFEAGRLRQLVCKIEKNKPIPSAFFVEAIHRGYQVEVFGHKVGSVNGVTVKEYKYRQNYICGRKYFCIQRADHNYEIAAYRIGDEP